MTLEYSAKDKKIMGRLLSIMAITVIIGFVICVVGFVYCLIKPENSLAVIFAFCAIACLGGITGINQGMTSLEMSKTKETTEKSTG